jgi:REP element-mobilizing transposase RayT
MRRVKKTSQLSLFIPETTSTVFGGSRLKSNPKEKRPVSRKNAMHFVLRSSHAKGKRSMRCGENRKRVDGIIYKQAKASGIRIYKYQNMGNHLHILLRVHDRRLLARYLRAISGLIARVVLGCERGSPTRIKQFWDGRPFSRIVEWGKAYKDARNYLEKNRLQALGFDFQLAATNSS